MINQWDLKSAKIVIPVLSGISNNKAFKNLKMVESLKSGIKNVCDLSPRRTSSSFIRKVPSSPFLQAANASEVWFLTNGLDAGVPQLIGTAFREETVGKGSLVCRLFYRSAPDDEAGR